MNRSAEIKFPTFHFKLSQQRSNEATSLVCLQGLWAPVHSPQLIPTGKSKSQQEDAEGLGLLPPTAQGEGQAVPPPSCWPSSECLSPLHKPAPPSPSPPPATFFLVGSVLLSQMSLLLGLLCLYLMICCPVAMVLNCFCNKHSISSMSWSAPEGRGHVLGWEYPSYPAVSWDKGIRGRIQSMLLALTWMLNHEITVTGLGAN